METSSYNEVYNSDPNKNKFGEVPSKDGWRLAAQVQPLGTSKLFFTVALLVTADDPTRIKEDSVTFHLHPTFSEPVRTVPIVGTSARLEVIASGAFTVGVEINGGETRLELDLATLPDAPKEFRAR